MNYSRFKKDAKAIFQVGSGNFLEMYDFSIFGLYAPIIAKVFFPSENTLIAIMQTFMVFAVGSFMRPVGAMFLGAYMDKYGRKKGLMLTLSLMAIGTASIALCPGYESIGFLAPLIVVLGRLVQGFSAGAELGGVVIYLSEIAPKGLKGFYVAWQSGSQQLATAFAAALGLGLHYVIGQDLLDSFGWRIPFLIGCLVVPFLFLIRKSLEESPEFANKPHKTQPLGKIIKNAILNWRLMSIGIMMVMTTTTFYYFITVYTPTYAKNILHFSVAQSFGVTVMVAFSNLIWLLVSGYISDRIGRKKVLIFATVLGFFTAYPALLLLVKNLNFPMLIGVELWLSMIYALYNGTMAVALSEIVPKEVRAVGFSFAYSVAVALFGSLTPIVSTYFIALTNNAAIPGVWLGFVALCSFVAVLCAYARS